MEPDNKKTTDDKNNPPISTPPSSLLPFPPGLDRQTRRERNRDSVRPLSMQSGANLSTPLTISKEQSSTAGPSLLRSPSLPPKSPRLKSTIPSVLPHSVSSEVQSASQALQALIEDEPVEKDPNLPDFVITKPDEEVSELSEWYRKQNHRSRRPSMSRMLMAGYIAKEFPDQERIRQKLSAKIPDAPQMQYLDVPANSEVWGVRRDVQKAKWAKYPKRPITLVKVHKKPIELDVKSEESEATAVKTEQSETTENESTRERALETTSANTQSANDHKTKSKEVSNNEQVLNESTHDEKVALPYKEKDIRRIQEIEESLDMEDLQFEEEQDQDDAAFTNFILQGYRMQTIVRSHLSTRRRRP